MKTPSITEMMKALLSAGMTQQSIAEAIGVTQPTVFRALNGAELRYCVGKELEQLYAEKVRPVDGCGAERREADRRQRERRRAERRA